MITMSNKRFEAIKSNSISGPPEIAELVYEIEHMRAVFRILAKEGKCACKVVSVDVLREYQNEELEVK